MVHDGVFLEAHYFFRHPKVPYHYLIHSFRPCILCGVELEESGDVAVDDGPFVDRVIPLRIEYLVLFDFHDGIIHLFTHNIA